MCDIDTQKDADNYLKTHSELSRREFTTLATGAGMAMMMPSIASAQSISERDVEIRTPDGVADCHFAYPQPAATPQCWCGRIFGATARIQGNGPQTGAGRLRSADGEPFYRDARSPVVGLGASFGQPEIRNLVLPMARNLNADTHFTDARTFTAWLDEQDEVDTSKGIGTTGYCMGGPMVMRTVAAVPERFAAGATFHGGGLATGNPIVHIYLFLRPEHPCCIVLLTMMIRMILRRK